MYIYMYMYVTHAYSAAATIQGTTQQHQRRQGTTVCDSRLGLLDGLDNEQRQEVAVGSVLCLLPLYAIAPVLQHFNQLFDLIRLLRDELLLEACRRQRVPAQNSRCVVIASHMSSTLRL